jgi:hypothetical protein
MIEGSGAVSVKNLLAMLPLQHLESLAMSSTALKIFKLFGQQKCHQGDHKIG